MYHGADVAEAIWDEMGASCSNIWGYEDAVADYLDAYYPTDTSNWRTNAFNEGVEGGAEQVVDKYEYDCLEGSPDECNDLGQVAAQRELCSLYRCTSSSHVTYATTYLNNTHSMPSCRNRIRLLPIHGCRFHKCRI